MNPENHPSLPSKPDWARFFRDSNGRIVIAQFPNWPLWIWLAATVLEHSFANSDGLGLARLTSFVAIIYWAYLEIVEGVNPFRKCLGGSVVLFVLYTRLGTQLFS